MRGKKSNNGASSFSMMHAALILLCVVLISGHLMGGIYARYVAESTGGDGARVIYFGDITLTIDDINTPLIPGVNNHMQARVSFDGSEAQTYVFVAIDGWTYDEGSGTIKSLIDHEAIDISVGVNTQWTRLATTDESVVLYMALDPNENTLENGVAVFNEGQALNMTVANTVTAEQLEKLTTISMTAYAVQGNGFAGAEAAWESVSKKVSKKGA